LFSVYPYMEVKKKKKSIHYGKNKHPFSDL
jgi:hypothetical protein